MFDKVKDKYKEKNWYADKYQSLLVQRNILSIIAIISLVVAMIALFAVNRMAPLKTVKPFVVKIEEKNGAIEVVDPDNVNKYSVQRLVAENFIQRYVYAREGYYPLTSKYNYSIVRVMSLPAIFRKYDRFMRINEDSPINKLGLKGSREIEILSISFLESSANNNLAQVRMKITELLKTHRESFNKIALVGFDYTKLDLGIEDRRINPLGFTVSLYKVDDEIVK